MITLKVNDKEYKLRLTSRAIRDLETAEKKSIIKVFTSMEEGSLLDPILKVLYYALKSNHPELKYDDVYTIYDDLVEYEGYTVDDTRDLIEKVLATAGLVNKETPKE